MCVCGEEKKGREERGRGINDKAKARRSKVESEDSRERERERSCWKTYIDKTVGGGEGHYDCI